MRSFVKHVLSTLVFLSYSVSMSAFFEAVNEDGVTIYYDVLPFTQNCCEVSCSSVPGRYHGVVNIPPTVQRNGLTYIVTRIGAYAFKDCSVTSVTMPSTITSIEDHAFSYCI